MFRAVLDPNVIVGRFLASSPTSPNVEVVERLKNAEFRALYSEDVVAEYLELLDRMNVPESLADEFVSAFLKLSEFVFSGSAITSCDLEKAAREGGDSDRGRVRIDSFYKPE